jgi:hypothetical protein
MSKMENFERLMKRSRCRWNVDRSRHPLSTNASVKVALSRRR